MPIETLTTDEQVSIDARERNDDQLRKLAKLHVERVRKFKRSLAVYVLSLLVLTPLWVWEQYETSPGWLKHLSTRSRFPGDWDPWIIWVALIGGAIVAVLGYRAYFDRPATEAAILGAGPSLSQDPLSCACQVLGERGREMHARVSTLTGSPDQAEVGIQDFKDEVVPWVKEHGGRGGILLIDRSSGKAIAATLWNDEESMRQSEEAANEHRRRVSEEMQTTQAPSVERFEVAVLEI